MKCEKCGIAVEVERAEFLLEMGKAITCPQHSREEKQLVLMDYGHKTAGVAVVVPNDKEQQRLAMRAFRRSR